MRQGDGVVDLLLQVFVAETRVVSGCPSCGADRQDQCAGDEERWTELRQVGALMMPSHFNAHGVPSGKRTCTKAAL